MPSEFKKPPYYAHVGAFGGWSVYKRHYGYTKLYQTCKNESEAKKLAYNLNGDYFKSKTKN